MNRSDSRREAKPQVEAIFVFGGLATPMALINIVADGKTYSFECSRRVVMSLCEQGFGALKAMEPGK